MARLPCYPGMAKLARDFVAAFDAHPRAELSGAERLDLALQVLEAPGDQGLRDDLLALESEQQHEGGEGRQRREGLLHAIDDCLR